MLATLATAAALFASLSAPVKATSQDKGECYQASFPSMEDTTMAITTVNIKLLQAELKTLPAVNP